MNAASHDILEGDSLSFTRDQKLFAFHIAKKAIHEIGHHDDNDQSEETNAKRAHFITQAFSQHFGGDWACILGKQKALNGTNFSFYIPSIRNLSFLIYEKYFVFVAQIFEMYKQPNIS